MKFFILILLVSFSNIFAQTSVIHGKLLNNDGTPLVNGKVLFYVLHDTASNVSVDVGEDGAYKILSKKEGLAFIEYSGTKNETRTVAIYLNGTEKIDLNVYLANTDSKIIFSEQNRFHADFSANYDSIFKRQAALSSKLREHKQTEEDINDFEFNWSQYKSFLIDQIQKTTNKILKQELLFSYIDLGYGTYGAELDETIVKLAFAEIPPNSSLWSIEPFNIGTALTNLSSPEKYDSYIKEIITTHPDFKVRDVVKNNFGPDRKIFKGKYFPDISISSLIDSTIKITSERIKGKYTLIDFWATWCKPCLEEMPNLHKVYEEYKDEGLEILSISLDNDRAAAIKFLEDKWRMPWLKAYIGLDKKLLAYFEISGIPKAILLDQNGKIIATDYKLRGKKLQKTIRNLLR
ncbi:MAG: TlpA disulfide reductase family protein [Bacteroidota bacterium]